MYMYKINTSLGENAGDVHDAGDVGAPAEPDPPSEEHHPRDP
jgi:hypothetical protein